MTFVYPILLFLALCFYIPVYFVKLKVLRREKLHLKERLGMRPPSPAEGTPSVWIHAVSVGEVHSLQSLIRILRERHPDWSIYFSTLTNTGMSVARKKILHADRIFFIPFDFGWLIRRYFKALRPEVFVLAESEFWPALLREAGRCSRAVLLINGRISNKSCRKYTLFRSLMKKILNPIDFFLLQTEKEKSCLVRIGISPDRLEVAGNLKSDVDLPEFDRQQVLQFKSALDISADKKVILAGSTHAGEEEILLQAFSEAFGQTQEGMLIIAPRHPERTGEVERLCRSFDLTAVRRTAVPVRGITDWNVLIVDTLGELAQMYALCDLAFVGGSLIPWGGQNLLEPAFYGKPIFFGPHMDNFADLAQAFLKAGAARIVRDVKDLAEAFQSFEIGGFEEMGARSREVLGTLQGATDRTLKVIESSVRKGRNDAT